MISVTGLCFSTLATTRHLGLKMKTLLAFPRASIRFSRAHRMITFDRMITFETVLHINPPPSLTWRIEYHELLFGEYGIGSRRPMEERNARGT